MISDWSVSRLERYSRTALRGRDEVLAMCLAEARETGEPIRANNLMAIRIMSAMSLEIVGQIARGIAGLPFEEEARARLRSWSSDLSLLSEMLA